MLLDPKFTRALRKRTAALVILCQVDHPNGMTYLWSGIGTLRYAGQNWLGVGHLGAITTSPRTTELRIDEVRLILSGIDPEALMQIDDNIRNRRAWTWLAAVGPRHEVVGTPLLLDEILLDYATDSLDEQGVIRLTLIGQSGFWTLERSTESAWSREEAILRWGVDSGGEPNETGFDYITSLRTKDTKWKPPAS